MRPPGLPHGVHAASEAARLGRTLVVVPHPDDETIGCGGLLALLAAARVAVQVVLVSDGAASHPDSHEFTAPRMRALRAGEMVTALCELGLGAQHLKMMGLPDGDVPSAGGPAFDLAVVRLVRKMVEFRPACVLLPCNTDQHPDHRATHAIGTAACDLAAFGARRLAYTVWPPDGERGVAGITPTARHWSIDVRPVLDKKRRALAAHRSQLGQVVHDDPHGFQLPAMLIDRCNAALETYIDITPHSAP